MTATADQKWVTSLCLFTIVRLGLGVETTMVYVMKIILTCLESYKHQGHCPISYVHMGGGGALSCFGAPFRLYTTEIATTLAIT